MSRAVAAPDRKVSWQERRQLADAIEKLEPQYLARVCDIVLRDKPNARGDDGAVTVDVESLSTENLRALQRVARDAWRDGKRQKPGAA